MKKRLPPYGKLLAERLRYSNAPFLVVVCIGLDAWERAKIWSDNPNNIAVIVQPHDTHPNAFNWPVSGLHVIVDWDAGPSTEQVIGLCQALLSQGAATTTVRPLFTNEERIRTYHRQGVRNAA